VNARKFILIKRSSIHRKEKTMSLISLVYASLANENFSDDQLKALLKKAREKNASLDITGMLLYRDGFFLQVLEGEESQLDNLFKVISNDNRHRDALIIYKKTLKERVFSSWTMGFNKIEDNDVASLEGYNVFLQTPTVEFFKGRETYVTALLEQFKHNLLF
jgi:hypothetical protein